LLLYME